MKNALSAAMVLIGTFIGAGFASGQEIIQYFGIFGNYGIFGMVISCLLLGLFTYCTTDNICFLGEGEYVNVLCKFKWVSYIINGYMILIFATMITAFGESFEQMFHLPKMYGVLIINIVTMIILHFGADAVVKFNVFVTPLIISGIIISFFANNTVSVFNNFGISAIVYTSYNVITLPFVILGMKEMLRNKKVSALCSIIFSIIIFVLALCIFVLLKGVDGESVQIPLLSVVLGWYVYVLGFVLAMSMLTTAVSSGYGLVNAVNIAPEKVMFFLFFFALFFSMLRFNFIVKYLYMVFGYMGIYILVQNFCIFIKNREKPRKIKIINNNRK
ncbi:MAG: hypothetical protein UH854_04440 [Clostridia bacterium]|nr:hypothetical protein [Clostridia bacterium]